MRVLDNKIENEQQGRVENKDTESEFAAVNLMKLVTSLI